ncbi:MAG TPA: HEAT repeat domain-containing protein [Vicinamibacteria bacterium]|nr:HEAT repeat domain-containing protein [Vicinamibacteria bacterium]
MTARRFALLLACLALAGAGCRSKPRPPDIPALVADLIGADEAKSGAASLKLVDIGEAAAPALADALRGGDARVRKVVAATLWGMGAKGRAAVPDLAACLGDADYEVRVGAAMALENMGPAAAPAVPDLVRALKDREGIVRQRAAKALGAIGPAAAEALPALEGAARLDSVRPAAEEAMARIRAGAPPSP